jgi:hypothetical protein
MSFFGVVPFVICTNSHSRAWFYKTGNVTYVPQFSHSSVLGGIPDIEFYGPTASVRLTRCAISMTLTSAAQSSSPTGVRPYQTVGGDVGLVERAIIPSRSSLRRQLVSILAETFPISN